MYEFRLGRAIAQIVPFYIFTQQQPRQQREDKPLITNKLIIIFGITVIAVIKVINLFTWR